MQWVISGSKEVAPILTLTNSVDQTVQLVSTSGRTHGALRKLLKLLAQTGAAPHFNILTIETDFCDILMQMSRICHGVN